MTTMHRFVAAVALTGTLAGASLSLAADPAGDARPALAVRGVANQIDNQDWRDARVAMGLRNRLAQMFADVNRFALLDEKAEIDEHRRRIVAQAWAFDQDGAVFEGFADKPGARDLDYVAYGRVFYFGKPTQTVSFGPMRAQRNSTVVKIEVVLKNVKTGQRIARNGKGVASTRIRSGLFTFHEDRLALDRSAVGVAADKALAEAVDKVMEAWDTGAYDAP